MSRSIWSTLGLKATRDIAEIKRAYAAKLKAMDIDANPAAFQLLREARDIAVRLAQQEIVSEPLNADNAGGPSEAATLDEGPSEIAAAAERPIDTPDSIETQEAPPLDPDTLELNRHHDALCAILFDIHDDQFYAATPDEEQAMLGHFSAIAASPNVQNVDTLANAANWFAGAIAQMTPRSDVLIEPASKLFGWDQADELAEDPALAAVMQRRADLRYRDEVSQPSHRLNGAWKELITPANENSRKGWQRRKKVMELLAKVRSDHPTLERQFDWYRASLWENSGAELDNRKLWPFFLGIFLLLRVCAAAYHQEPASSDSTPVPLTQSPPPSEPLSTSDRDVDAAIRRISGDRITGERLRRENAKLYQLIHGHWLTIQSEGGRLDAFNEQTHDLIYDRLPDAWAYVDSDLLRDFFELRRDIGQSLARTSAEACTAYFTGGPRQLLPQQREREEALKARAILQIDPDRPINQDAASAYQYRIPGDVVEQVRQKTGLTESALSNALDFKGDKAIQCKVQIATFDVILAQPSAARTRILRDMTN